MDGELIEKIPTISKRNEAVEQIDILFNGLNSIDILELTELGTYISKKAETTANYEQYLSTLKKELLDLPIAEIIIAFVPNNRDTMEIVRAVRGDINQNAVVDIQVNPHLIGGAIVSFEGKYHDGSLITKLENV